MNKRGLHEHIEIRNGVPASDGEKFRALHRGQLTEPLVCPGCQKKFMPKNGRQKYHSTRCRHAHHQRQHRRARLIAAGLPLDDVKTAAWRRAAKRLGISLEEYREHRNNGERWCIACADWHKEEDFYKSAHQPDGLSTTCKHVKRNPRKGLWRKKSVGAARVTKPKPVPKPHITTQEVSTPQFADKPLPVWIKSQF